MRPPVLGLVVLVVWVVVLVGFATSQVVDPSACKLVPAHTSEQVIHTLNLTLSLETYSPPPSVLVAPSQNVAARLSVALLGSSDSPTLSTTLTATAYNITVGFPSNGLYVLALSIDNTIVADAQAVVVRVLAACSLGEKTVASNELGGVFSCEPCSPGEYADVTNTSTCTLCPPFPKDPPTPDSPLVQRVSPPGASSRGSCVCPSGYYPTWTPDSHSELPGCAPCPAFAVCNGTGAPLPIDGFAAETSRVAMARCEPVSACWTNRSEQASYCCKGHTGRLCSRCLPQFFRAQRRCEPCTSKAHNPATTAVLAVALVALVLVFLAFLLSHRAIHHDSAARSFAQVTGTERYHSCREALRWLRRLWCEISLLFVNAAFVVSLALLGLRDQVEAAVVFLGLTAVTGVFILRRVNSFRAASKPVSHLTEPGAESDDDDDIPYVLMDDMSEGSGDSDDMSDGGQGRPLAAAPLSPVGKSSGRASMLSLVSAHEESVVKSGVVYLQTVSTILELYGVDASYALRRFGVFVGQVSVQVSGVQCYGLGVFGELFAFAMIPVTLLCLVGSVYGVHRWLQRLRHAHTLGIVEGYTVDEITARALEQARSEARALWSRALHICIVVVYVFFFPLASRAFSMYGCAKEVSTKRSFLLSHPWIECGSQEHVRLAILASCILCVLLFVCLAVGRMVMLGLYGSEGGNMYAPVVSFMVKGFRQKYWWVEGVVLVRRVVFAACASLMHNSEVVGLVLTCILLSWLMLTSITTPYRTRSSGWVEILVSLVSLTTLVTASSMSSSSKNSIQLEQSWIIILVNCVAIVAVLVGLAAPFAWGLGR